MSFNPRNVEASISLGRMHPEDLPAVAWDALEAGHEGQAVCLMAALQRPTSWDTDPLLPEFMLQTGMQRLSVEEAVGILAAQWASEILETRTDPLRQLGKFARLCSEIHYPETLMGLYMLDDECFDGGSIYGRTLDQVRAEARDELIRLKREHESAEEHL